MGFSKFYTWQKLCLIAFVSLFSSYGQAPYSRELATRQNDAASAFEMLKEGDLAYGAGDYKKATETFRAALTQTPSGTTSKALRTELGERYATAAAQEAKRLASIGDRAKAREILTDSLVYAPDNSYAKRQLEYLDDPIRTNPALTKEHSKNVDAVRQLLYVAEGAYNLGSYDEASKHYNAILRIDKFNKAARRGLERVLGAKSEYYDAARDHTKAELMSQVDSAWEIGAPRGEAAQNLELVTLVNSRRDESSALTAQKLEAITLPVVDFVDFDLYEALEQLRVLSKEFDFATINPADKGVQFIAQFNSDSKEPYRRFNLNLTNVPLGKVLESMSQLLGIKYVSDYGVVKFLPHGSASDTLYNKSYNVPSDFLTTGPSSPAKNDDPFGASDKAPSVFAGARKTAQEVLEGYGIKFENGATAHYLPATSTLLVKTSETEHQVIGNIIDTLSKEQPLSVRIEVKFISIEQNNTDEIGVDFAIENTIYESILAGGSAGNQGDLEGVVGNPLTSGNRSGDVITDQGGIDSVLNRPNGSIGQISSIGDVVDIASGQGGLTSTFGDAAANGRTATVQRAPGILSLAGTVNEGAFSALLRGLDQKKGTDFVLNPSFVTRSGQQAQVLVGQEFIYPTEYDPPEISDGNGNAGNNDDLENQTNAAAANTGFTLTFDLFLRLIRAEVFGTSFGDSATSVTPANPTAFETANLGVELDIIPTVSSDGATVDLNVDATYRQLDGFINYGSPIPGVITDVRLENSIAVTTPIFATLPNGEVADFIFFANTGNPELAFGPITVSNTLFEASSNDILMPVFSTIHANTGVTVYDGATMILGGFIEANAIRAQDETPILSKVPILGRAFQTDADQVIKKHVLITITANVIDATGQSIKVSR